MLGKYLLDALTLAHMSQTDLADKWGKSSSVISRVMSGESRTVNRKTLIIWCSLMDTPYWLEERILNTAGFATEKQVAQYNNEKAAEESREKVQEELGK